MPSKKVQRKFIRRGRQAAFARLADVSEVTVSMWLRGKLVSARLDKLAREWKPVVPAESQPQQLATQAA